jgi:hypothetical protein
MLSPRCFLRCLLLLIVSALVACGGAPPGDTADVNSAPTISKAQLPSIAQRTVVITARHSGKVLDVAGAGLNDGAAVIQYTRHGDQNQQWQITPLSNDEYQLAAVHSGKCLDVAGASTNNSAPLIQWTCNGGGNQRFRFEPVSATHARLVAVHSGKCVDIAGVSLDNSAAAIQYDCHDGENQQFALDAGGTPVSFIADENIVFPADAGVIDVTKPPYNAVPSDGVDDATAIQRALNDNPTNNKIIYFPNGVYDISDVNVTAGGQSAALQIQGSQRRNIFQGQSQSGTVLRLMDSVPASFTGAVVNFGPKPAQRFRNSMRNMTISVGVGHASAIGVQFNASNQGTLQEVTVKSEDGTGATGLDMRYTDEVGPLLVKSVTIDGFDRGIWTRFQTASQTFEGITLKNQRRFGWENSASQTVFARKLNSTNAVPAVRNNDDANNGQGRVLLIDSVLTGVGGAANVGAIVNQKSLYARNVDTLGYLRAVQNNVAFGRGNGPVNGVRVDEYFANGAGTNRSGAPFELFASPDKMLGLPIKESPHVPWEQDLAKWAGPVQFGGKPNDGIDDTAAIQAAIDAAGVTTVYLPNGNWNVNGTLVLRGNVSRFLGTEASISMGPQGVLRIDANAPPLVAIERLEGLGRVEHAGSNTLVFNNLLGLDYVPVAANPGEIYFNDVAMGAVTFRNQSVWARQLNIETEITAAGAAKLVNDNATVWILGYKTENAGTLVKTINGGRTELLGALHVGRAAPAGGTAAAPRFVTVESSFSAAIILGGDFTVDAEETRGGVTQTSTSFNFADGYTAYP